MRANSVVSNSNNRNLQVSIGGFTRKEISIKNQKIRNFNVSPAESKAYIAKVKEEAVKQRRRNIAFYTVLILINAALIYFFWFVEL